jgi:hypothetical protein
MDLVGAGSGTQTEDEVNIDSYIPPPHVPKGSPDGGAQPQPKPDPPPEKPDHGTADGGTKLTDGESGGGTGTITEDQVRHVIDVRGGDTDVVEGHDGGPTIDDAAPPAPAIDLVKNPNPDDSHTTVDVHEIHLAPPGQEISHTVNPDLGPDFGHPDLGGGTDEPTGYALVGRDDEEADPDGVDLDDGF